MCEIIEEYVLIKGENHVIEEDVTTHFLLRKIEWET
jgi:hypothetical protein